MFGLCYGCNAWVSHARRRGDHAWAPVFRNSAPACHMYAPTPCLGCVHEFMQPARARICQQNKHAYVCGGARSQTQSRASELAYEQNTRKDVARTENTTMRMEATPSDVIERRHASRRTIDITYGTCRTNTATGAYAVSASGQRIRAQQRGRKTDRNQNGNRARR